MKERRSGPIIVAVVAIPLLLFAAYMGSYYAILQEAREETRPLPEGWLLVQLEPHYRMDTDLITVVFRPAHQLDRRIRPGYWGDE